MHGGWWILLFAAGPAPTQAVTGPICVSADPRTAVRVDVASPRSAVAITCESRAALRVIVKPEGC